MEMNEKRPEPMHPFVDIDGFIAEGKQFDLDITLANDHRDVIYGVIRDCFKEPVKEAVVKLVEVDYKYGKKELKPVSHTFTDENGDFVFGPLCPGKKYAIQIWKDDVKHIKVCAKCHHAGKCLKGIELDCDYKDDYKDDYKYYEKYEDKYEDKDKEKHEDKCKDKHEDKHDDKHDDKDKCKCQDDYKPEYMKY